MSLADHICFIRSVLIHLDRHMSIYVRFCGFASITSQRLPRTNATNTKKSFRWIQAKRCFLRKKKFLKKIDLAPKKHKADKRFRSNVNQDCVLCELLPFFVPSFERLLRFYAINCTSATLLRSNVHIYKSEAYCVVCNICRDRSLQHTMTGVARREKKTILLNCNAAVLQFNRKYLFKYVTRQQSSE